MKSVNPRYENENIYWKKQLITVFSTLRCAQKHAKVKSGALYLGRQPPSITVLVVWGPHGASYPKLHESGH